MKWAFSRAYARFNAKKKPKKKTTTGKKNNKNKQKTNKKLRNVAWINRRNASKPQN